MVRLFKSLRSFYKCFCNNAKPPTAVVSFIVTEQKINSITGNGKSFIAYDIIKRLKENNEIEITNLLADAVETKRTANNKKHDVCELSLDWKYCSSHKFIQQKIDYI